MTVTGSFINASIFPYGWPFTNLYTACPSWCIPELAKALAGNGLGSAGVLSSQRHNEDYVDDRWGGIML